MQQPQLVSGKNNLIIFSGPNCKWCKKLKTILEDQILQAYCQENNIAFAWFELLAKSDEEAACESGACQISLRNKYNIKSIPTAILFDGTGTVQAQTEYIDAVEDIGGKAYVAWVEENSLF